MFVRNLTWIETQIPIQNNEFWNKYPEIIGTMCHECTSHKSISQQCRKIMATPDNMCCCHKCNNRLCINVQHLYNGTYADNFDDALKSKRTDQTLGPIGNVGTKRHPLSDEHKSILRQLVVGRECIKRICPHCGKSGGGGAMFRWHFDNCAIYLGL